MSFDWTQRRVDRLVSGWAVGDTAAVIAAEFGCGRNAVIGKVNRLRESGVVMKLRQRGVQKPKLARVAILLSSRAPIVGLPAGSSDPQPPLHLTLQQLGEKHCRWPYGEVAPYLFCGHQHVAGNSYCSHHMRVSYRPAR